MIPNVKCYYCLGIRSIYLFVRGDNIPLKNRKRNHKLFLENWPHGFGMLRLADETQAEAEIHKEIIKKQGRTL